MDTSGAGNCTNPTCIALWADRDMSRYAIVAPAHLAGIDIVRKSRLLCPVDCKIVIVFDRDPNGIL